MVISPSWYFILHSSHSSMGMSVSSLNPFPFSFMSIDDSCFLGVSGLPHARQCPFSSSTSVIHVYGSLGSCRLVFMAFSGHISAQ